MPLELKIVLAVAVAVVATVLSTEAFDMMSQPNTAMVVLGGVALLSFFCVALFFARKRFEKFKSDNEDKGEC